MQRAPYTKNDDIVFRRRYRILATTSYTPQTFKGGFCLPKDELEMVPYTLDVYDDTLNMYTHSDTTFPKNSSYLKTLASNSLYQINIDAQYDYGTTTKS